MRYLLVLLIAVALAGCSTPSRGRTGGPGGQPTSGKGQQPFLGTPVSPGGGGSASAAGEETTNLTSAGPTRKEGVLAGRVLDPNNRLRPGALIRVVDLESSREAGANLSVKANRDGYFDINGLEAGKSYRLVAQSREGDKVLYGSSRVIPPNVRVAIFLNDESPADAMPPETPPAPTVDITEPKPAGPSATLGPPTKHPPGAGVVVPPPATNETMPPPPPGVGTIDPSLMADRGSPTPDAPRVNIEGVPGREPTRERPGSTVVIPPPPGANEDPPAAEEKPEGLSRVVVPSCQRIGQRVENFTLYDVKGKVFELRKDRRGKLVLLDMWYTGCPPCRRAIPQLNALQTKYGKYGLEVIGVTYEQGTLAEKQQTLEAAKQRHRLAFNYKLLFGGGGKGNCPVAEQLELHHYPTLVLLDEAGKIVWRGEGLDERNHYELEMAIYQRLVKRKDAD